jgi:hypothetical protein
MATTLSTQIRGAQKTVEELEALFSCPFSLDTLEDPVSDKCGHTFERNLIELWLQSSNTCPLCRKNITIGGLAPNRMVKQAIDILKQRGRATDGSVAVTNENERAIVSEAEEKLRSQTCAKKSADSVEKSLNYLSSLC